MPRRLVPEEVFTAASEHVLAAHEHTLQPGEVGRPTSRAASISLTWDYDELLGLRFLCRRCEPGFGRFVVALEREEPTQHLRALIVRHFEEAKHEPLTEDELGHAGNLIPEPRAVFIPMLVHLGAGIVCKECPEGLNLHYLTPPPHGDARRIHYLLRTRQDLRERTKRFSPLEQAAYIEAWDRGELQLRERLSGRRALGKTAEEAGSSPLELALGRLLLTRTQAGAGVTRLIDELHELSLESPVTFTAELATVLPGFSQLAESVPPEVLARAVARSLGFPERDLPMTNRSQLWRIWRDVRG